MHCAVVHTRHHSRHHGDQHFSFAVDGCSGVGCDHASVDVGGGDTCDALGAVNAAVSCGDSSDCCIHYRSWCQFG